MMYFPVSLRGGARLLLRHALSLHCPLWCTYTSTPAAAAAAGRMESPPVSLSNGRRFIGGTSGGGGRGDASGDTRTSSSNSGSSCSSSSSSSLETRIAELERKLETLQGVVEEHGRHFKEFVIEKVIDLEDELRELGQKWDAANEAAFPQQHQETPQPPAAAAAAAAAAAKGGSNSSSTSGTRADQHQSRWEMKGRSTSSEREGTVITYETIDVAVVETHPAAATATAPATGDTSTSTAAAETNEISSPSQKH